MQDVLHLRRQDTKEDLNADLEKLGLTVVLYVLSAGMTVNAGFTGSNVHSTGQSMGVGGLLEESMDRKRALRRRRSAKETRKRFTAMKILALRGQ